MTEMSDQAIFQIQKLDRHGRPKGKLIAVTYSIDWRREAEITKLKDQFISQLSLPASSN